MNDSERKQLANNVEETFRHPMSQRSTEIFCMNMKIQWNMEESLLPWELVSFANTIASVAYSLGSGIDPEVLRMTSEERNEYVASLISGREAQDRDS